MKLRSHPSYSAFPDTATELEPVGADQDAHSVSRLGRGTKGDGRYGLVIEVWSFEAGSYGTNTRH